MRTKRDHPNADVDQGPKGELVGNRSPNRSSSPRRPSELIYSRHWCQSGDNGQFEQLYPTRGAPDASILENRRTLEKSDGRSHWPPTPERSDSAGNMLLGYTPVSYKG
jgi:hypothetical protein